MILGDLPEAERLAILTGVNEEHADLFLRGELRPDHSHKEKLSKAANSIGLNRDVDTHRAIWPEEQYMIRTIFSRAPEGHSIVQLPVTELTQGDMIPFAPANKGSMGRGQWWMQVVKVVEHDKWQVQIHVKGEYVVFANSHQSIRAARVI